MTESLNIRVKRVYESPCPDDGKRYLVDGLWPRGLKKSSAHLDGWFKDIAPSAALRQRFDHKPERWEEFQRRYFAELDEKADIWRPLLHAARSPEGMTLLFAARDTEHNNAVALKRYLEARHNKAGEES